MIKAAILALSLLVPGTPSGWSVAVCDQFIGLLVHKLAVNEETESARMFVSEHIDILEVANQEHLLGVQTPRLQGLFFACGDYRVCFDSALRSWIFRFGSEFLKWKKLGIKFRDNSRRSSRVSCDHLNFGVSDTKFKIGAEPAKQVRSFDTLNGQRLFLRSASGFGGHGQLLFEFLCLPIRISLGLQSELLALANEPCGVKGQVSRSNDQKKSQPRKTYFGSHAEKPNFLWFVGSVILCYSGLGFAGGGGSNPKRELGWAMLCLGITGLTIWLVA